MNGVLDVLICRREVEANFYSIFSKCVVESRSRTKTVVLSTYIDIFISFSPIMIPLIRLSSLMDLARSSRSMTNSKPEVGNLVSYHDLKEKNMKHARCLKRSW